MNKQAMVISGQFTEEDNLELMEVLRRIEQRHPEVTYQMVTADPDRNIEENIKWLRENFIPAPGVPFDVKHWTEFERGFVDGLQKAIQVGERHWRQHFTNAQNKELSQEDQEAALNCTAVIGMLISSLKSLGASLYRNQITVEQEKVTEKRLWWSNLDGKGAN